jgi:hypothetical protein
MASGPFNDGLGVQSSGNSCSITFHSFNKGPNCGDFIKAKMYWIIMEKIESTSKDEMIIVVNLGRCEFAE